MTEKKNIDKAITAEAKAINDMYIDLKDKQDTHADKKTMNINIKSNNIF